MHSIAFQPATQDQRNALHSLGITPEIMEQIGRRILSGYNQATPHDAANAAGSYAYFAAVKASRDILCPLGWSPLRKNNLEFVAQPTYNMLLLVSSGDKNTGIIGAEEPKTKNQKGNQTRKVVAKNVDQLLLWPELEAKEDVVDFESAPTWFLLYHVDQAEGVMRLELSLPVRFDMDELRVDGWRQRIVLNSIEFNAIPVFTEHDFAEEVNFEVKRKTL